jgi:hypothetical protein
MVKIIDTFMACADCVLLVANGEPCDARPYLKSEISNHLRLEPLQHLYMGDSDQNEECSWTPCQCCGSRLGGSRSQLVLLADPSAPTYGWVWSASEARLPR